LKQFIVAHLSFGYLRMVLITGYTWFFAGHILKLSCNLIHRTWSDFYTVTDTILGYLILQELIKGYSGHQLSVW